MHHPPVARLRHLVPALLMVVVVLPGCGGSQSARSGSNAPTTTITSGVTTTSTAVEAASTTVAPEAPSGVPAPSGTVPVTFPTGIVPVRVEIPAIGVDAATVDLDLRGDEPEVPSDFADTGWYTQTRLPGEIGPAVLAGHVDSVNGPAVFARLDELVEGDEITVHGTDGQTRVFVVTGSGRYPKGALPDEVFGFGLDSPELRLITCGGSFDRSVGHYRDNHVVYAVAS